MTTAINGRYELIESLGRGSFAHTFVARDLVSGRRVAIKMLNPNSPEGWKAYDLFTREAQVLAELRHHGIPAVYESFRASHEGVETAFLVMEYVEGPTLEHLINEGKTFSTREIHDLLLRLSDILIYLHERIPPILHRDIKPANIVLRDGRMPVLVDFGAVRNVFRAPDEDGSTVVGTYGYMPYEQYMGHASPPSDLYALGATFLHLITHRSPADFLSEDGHIVVPDQLPGSKRFHTILSRLLARAVTERFQSAAELREALLSNEHVTATQMAPHEKSKAPVMASVAQLVEEFKPGHRDLTGSTRDRYRKVAHSAWSLMNSETRPGTPKDAGSMILVGVLSVLTFGFLPLTFWGVAHARRRRLRRFFQEGTAAVAVITSMQREDMVFGEKWLRVSFEFEVDGESHRGSDRVLPAIADRWREGDAIAILYLPKDDFDSAIISSG